MDLLFGERCNEEKEGKREGEGNEFTFISFEVLLCVQYPTGHCAG